MLSTPELMVPLTTREREIGTLVGEGLSYRDIAEKLGVEVQYIRERVRAMAGKLSGDAPPYRRVMMYFRPHVSHSGKRGEPTGRDPTREQPPLTDRAILVTGGTGSFGQAFVQRALDDGARRVSVFSRGEAKRAAMRERFDDDRLRFLTGDVRDSERVMDACRDVEILIHAAALKRVEVCESDPYEAVATNIYGTRNVARACVERGIERAVFLSTDKAARPNTLYGTSKLAAERLWLGSNVYAAGTRTRLSATRYGNVIASTGSVIPIWQAQATTGTVKVTDGACSRFFMSMSEAVDLVLRALNEMRGGEVFVPKIPAAKLLDLAAVVAPDAAVQEIGLRPGEKIHETLITQDEARHTHDCGTHYVIEPPRRTWIDLPPHDAPLVPVDFAYRSDTVEQLSGDALRALVGTA